VPLTPRRHGRNALIAAPTARALDQITIGDDAGECGNRRIGKACSAHLRNSRTDRMHMVSPKWG